MKKHFIMAGILATSIIQPATAVTKCVALNSDTTCEYEAPSYNAADWTSTCTTNGVSTPISGIGICSSTEGASLFVTATELDISSTSDDNKYCWCRMISPAVSRWVHIGAYGSSGTCATGCANGCAHSPRNDSFFIMALFSSLSD